MSGALIQIAAKGVQDAYMISDILENSLFRLRYNRHTNFSQVPKLIEPVKGMGGTTIVVEVPAFGDLLTGMWLEGTDITERLRGGRVDLYIGGQKVDSQSTTFMSDVWSAYMADSYTKSQIISNRMSASDSTFLPLHFFFCDNWQFIPMTALQYHKVEIHIHTGSTAVDAKLYGHYVFLDTRERQALVEGSKKFVITQVQELSQEFRSDFMNIELSPLNHPVRALYWGVRIETSDIVDDFFTFGDADIHVNGSPLLEKMSPTYFHTVQGYYHSPTGLINMDDPTHSPFYTRFYTYNFGTNSSSYKPTGTMNFSRLDNARLTVRGASLGPNHTGKDITLFAVNYNILRIERGMGGVLFSN